MTYKNEVPVITIDGPSGTGKGTICHLLADHLGWHFLDSGALYRVLAYAAVNSSISFSEVDSLVSCAHALDLNFKVNGDGTSRVILNGQDISQNIRTEQAGQNASLIAAIPEVRIALLERQRAFATPPGLVTDGRDMGTVVFPKAKYKIYLHANAEERALRRYLQLKENGNDASLAQVVDELVKRDARDTTRSHAPLKPAEDAVLIDTTGLTVEQVFARVLQLIHG